MQTLDLCTSSTMWNLTCWKQLCTDLRVLVDKLNTSQQHALAAKMANSTLHFIKEHCQKVEAGDPAPPLGTA